MPLSPHAGLSKRGLPIASISGQNRPVFSTPADLERAWGLGFFYLKAPEKLGLVAARQFGSELISRDSPYRQISQYGELEGFIALENNQQTKLALRRERWNLHYPLRIAAFGRKLDTLAC